MIKDEKKSRHDDGKRSVFKTVVVGLIRTHCTANMEIDISILLSV